MSNKRQKYISEKRQSTTTTKYIPRRCRCRHYSNEQCCSSSPPRILEYFVRSLLFTLSILCIIASAKLETVTATDFNSKKQLSKETFDDDGKHENQLQEHEKFYRSELKRLPYETINHILRDEQESIFRRDDSDLRYYHARSLQPTHEVMRRSAEEIEQELEDQDKLNLSSSINSNMSSTLNLSAQNLNEFEISLNSTKYLDEIISIDLSGNHLQTIQLGDFKNLLTVSLANNLLSELPIASNSTIQLLNLNSNCVRKGQAPPNDQLRTLLLSGNKIENLTALNLSMLNSLETLDLSCNRIRNLETTFFPRMMHSLKYLNLQHNQLETISRETFYNLLSLNTLLLANNNITFIDYETFLSLPNLQYLDLSHNKLRGESIRALQGIPDLVGLSIAHNPEMGESLQEFVASWSLKEVDASGTGLCQIPAALAQAVRILKLSGNWFKIINCGDLESYPLLQYLDVSFSHIEDIEDDALGRLEFLEVLFLDHNQLRKVPISLPTSLEHLFLQHNEIMDLQLQAFQGLKNLKTLDLSHNKLLYLPALPLPKLLTLNLQSSGLQGLNQAIVHSLPHLSDLLLEENPIRCSDLLGIAEWASPCRIGNSKIIDTEQSASNALGSNLHQLANVEMDLKQQFIRTHDFYEKFKNNGGNCSNMIAKNALQSPSPPTPPSCAIELVDDKVDDVQEVQKPIDVMFNRNEKIAAQSIENGKEPTKSQLEATITTASATKHDHIAETTLDVSKKFTSATENSIIMNASAATAATAAATAEPTIQLNAHHALSTQSKAMTTEKFTTKDIVIETVTTIAAAAAVQQPTKSTTNNVTIDVMPKTIFSTIKSKQETTQQITSTIVPAILMASTSGLNNSSETTPTIATMPTNMPATMRRTAANSNYAMQYTATTRRGSLLERQRRVEVGVGVDVEQATMTAINATAITDKTLAPIPLKNKTFNKNGFEQDSGMNNSVRDEERRNTDDKNNEFRKTFENSENAGNSKPTAENTTISNVPTTTTTTTMTGEATTLRTQQHKHVALQLHVKDRHLIGTPLLMHQNDNLLVESGDVHLTATTTTTIKSKNLLTTSKPQKESDQRSSSNMHANNLSTTRELEMTTVGKDAIAPTTTRPTTRKPATKAAKKPHNDQTKRKLSLRMKKMTITTKHAVSTIPPSTTKLASQNQQQQQTHHHHHYTLNIPQENEATELSKSQTETMFNANHQMHLDKQQQSHHINNKHSTVNTPIINGHEHEVQTFQEHNELEEASAAYAHAHDAHEHAHAHAHASTSAIVGKIIKPSSTKTSTSAKWLDLRKSTAESAHPGIVILLSLSLFIVLLIGLLRVYRCDIPWTLRQQRHQQRPYRLHQQQQQQQQQLQLQQQSHFKDDCERHSFLSYQSNSSNQCNQTREWRLKAHQHNYQEKQQEEQTQQQQQQQQHTNQQHQSPFHILQVRELQQTSAIEDVPKYAKPTYKISSALGDRSNSQTSSTCSPLSSSIFDDETFIIEMTTDIAHGKINSDVNSQMAHSDLLPMELLNVVKETTGKNVEHNIVVSSNQVLNSSSNAFQTSSIDEEDAAKTLPNSFKQTTTTRKFGIW